MKTTIFAFAAMVATVFVAPSTTWAQDKLNPGDELPAMESTMKNMNGKSTSLKGAAKENGLLVMFSCNTCPFVIKNQEMTKKTIDYAVAHKVGVVVINSNEAKRSGDDSYDAMKSYAKDQGYAVPYLVDENSKIADLFGANHTPEIFLFNKGNKLVYKGAMSDNAGSPAESKLMYAQNAMNAMIAGKEADPKVTKSIGCSIKRKA